jgi:hypothetical protein
LGYIESTQSTAGTWATTPSKIQLWSSGIKLPGDIVQFARTTTSASGAGTGTIPFDDTIPQNTEGDEYMTQAITPTSAINKLDIACQAIYSNTVANNITVALFQDSTANALAATQLRIDLSNAASAVSMKYSMRAATTSSTTFKIRAGGSAAGTTGINNSAATRLYGGVAHSFLEIYEIMA